MAESGGALVDQYMKDLEGKGYKRSDMEGNLKFTRERIAYWSQQEKELKLLTPY